METPSFKESRRVTISVEALQQHDDEEPAALHDDAVAHVLSRGPEMSTTSEQEEAERDAVLNRGVQQTEKYDISPASVERPK